MKAIALEILEKLVETCSSNRLADLRDRALLQTAFAAGGRPDPGPSLPCMTIALGRTKTANAEDGESVILIGRPFEALTLWLKEAGIEKGDVFRAIVRWGNVKKTQISPRSVNLIIKSRCKLAGLSPSEFSAHGSRSGYASRPQWHPVAGSDGAVASSVCSAGGELL